MHLIGLVHRHSMRTDICVKGERGQGNLRDHKGGDGFFLPFPSMLSVLLSTWQWLQS